jgi:ketosteroid isomerase-like protein
VAGGLDLVRSFAEAFNRHDVPAMQALVTEDLVLTPLRAALERGTYKGREGIAEWVADLDDSWSEIWIEVDESREAAPDTMLVLGRVVGRGHGSTARVEAKAGWVALIRDGLIASIHTRLDQDEAERAATGNIAIAARCLDAMTNGDAETLAALCTEDVEVRPLRALLEDTEYRGREGIEQWMRDIRETWLDLRIEVEEIHEPRPDYVVALVTLHARGHESTAPTRMPVALTARMRDGLVTHAATQTDREAALRAAAGED